jgi:hypothetical protein
LQNKYAKDGLQIALMTQLFGYTMDKDHKPNYEVSVEEELAYDKKYWLEEHQIPFKIGVDVTTSSIDTTTKHTKFARAKWFTDSKVPGYPTFFLIDREGIVRRVWVGGGEKVDTKFAAEIEKVLGDKPSGTR